MGNLPNQKSRRDFLKNASVASIAIGGIALSGCGNNASNNGIKSASKKKKEILYRNTKQWSSYYASAK